MDGRPTATGLLDLALVAAAAVFAALVFLATSRSGVAALSGFFMVGALSAAYGLIARLFRLPRCRWLDVSNVIHFTP
jgi:hypothetical protein